MKDWILPIIAAMFGILILVSCANGMRQSLLLRMLERGFPQLAEGDASVLVRRIEWPPEAPVLEFRDFGGATQSMSVGDWGILFSPRPHEASYDISCGYGCSRALEISGMRCAPPLGTTMTDYASASCSLHVWTVGEDDGQEVCFFTLSEELPARTIPGLEMITGVKPSVPRELPVKCPHSLGWVD